MPKLVRFAFVLLAACDGAGPVPDAGSDAAADAPAHLEAGLDADAAPAPALTPSGPLDLSDAGDASFTGLHVTSDAGPCVHIDGVSNVTITASEIGPCAGNAVEISNADAITISDSYIHPEHEAAGCCDSADGVFATDTTNLTLQGNVIAFGEANIELTAAMHVHVVGNFLLNPQNAGSRGQNFQAWSNVTDVLVQGNYALSSMDAQYKYPEKQEDSINFGFADQIVAKDNYVTGGHSPSGCGIIADEAATNVQFLDNVLVDTGQCGISIASGTNQIVDGNKIINSTPVQGGGNTGLVVWSQYPDACGPVTVSNNVSSELKPDLVTESGYWNGGGCDPVTLTNDTFDAPARAALTPVAQKLPPPLVPPTPVACAPATPWTTQTAPPCWSPPSAQ
ncbi:MAG TPA: right-handed parallel beta-helix repeat-containing protein [Polyangiaceae bacterium]|jgi:hypothetical protein